VIEFLSQFGNSLVKAGALTLVITALSIAGALSLGTLLAVGSSAKQYAFRALSRGVVEVMRDLPLLVKIFALYFAVGLDAFAAVVVALSVHQAAYMSGIIRSGIESVSVEQREAAFASGLTPFKTLLHIVLPQAFRYVTPALSNQLIEVLKNSSAAVLVGIEELTFASQAIQYETFRYTEAFFVVLAGYFAVAMLISASMAAVRRVYPVR
jgi:polar amino acid transport system permease protein